VVIGAPDDPLAAYAGDPGAQVFRACVACHTLSRDEGEPKLKIDLAATLTAQHDLDGALASGQEALEAAKNLARAEPDAVGRQHDLAVAELGLGDLFITRGEPREALPHHRDASRLTTEISAKLKDNAGARAEMAYCLGILGKTLTSLSQNDEAHEKLSHARDIWIELRKSSPLTSQQQAAFADIEKALGALQDRSALHKKP